MNAPPTERRPAGKRPLPAAAAKLARHQVKRVRKVLKQVERRSRRVVAKELRHLPKRKQRVHRRVVRVYNMRHRVSYATRLDRVPDRDELPAILNRRGLVGTGVEIGVKLGKYSDYLLSNWKGAKLISIDPWLEAEPEEYIDRANVPQDQHEQFYKRTRELLAQYGPRSEIWRLGSVEGAAKVPDRSVDFVYIDARHDYDSVKEDLEAWFPKVRPSGVIAGHDYADGEFPQGIFGVKRAVDEFFAARGIPVHSTDGRPPAEMFATWIVEVPASAA
jgi:hypothetical protein